MSPAVEGLCAVCGVETNQRCSSCAEYGFDLFLCGREHQKLVWFAHKRVCGEKSSPFTFPLLSVEEAKEIKGSLDESVRGPGERPESLWHAISRATGYGKKEIPLLVDSLTVGTASDRHTRAEATALTAWLRRGHRKMSIIRAFQQNTDEFAHMMDPAHRSDRLAGLDPVVALSDFVTQLDCKRPYLAHTDFIQLGWFTRLAHQVSVTSALHYRYYSKFDAYCAIYGFYNDPNKPDNPAINELLQLRTASRTPLLAALDAVRVAEPDFADAVAQELALLPVFREERVAVGGWVFSARMTREVVRVQERLE